MRTPAGSDGSSSRSRSLHALDHVARVLAVAHDHDAADRVALAVEVGDAAADLGAERDLGHVAHQDRRAALVGLAGRSARGPPAERT